MGFFLIFVLLCVWIGFSVLVAKFTKTHFLWTFMFGLLGTIVALLLKLSDILVQYEKDIANKKLLND